MIQMYHLQSSALRNFCEIQTFYAFLSAVQQQRNENHNSVVAKGDFKLYGHRSGELKGHRWTHVARQDRELTVYTEIHEQRMADLHSSSPSALRPEAAWLESAGNGVVDLEGDWFCPFCPLFPWLLCL